MTVPKLQLRLLDDHLAVCKLDPEGEVPLWAAKGVFSSITRTHDEISVVCSEAFVPADVRSEKGWRCFRVAGSMDFSVVGVLASMTAPLAEAQIGILAISTFDTDYLLVKEADLDGAIEALAAHGHVVSGPDRME
jgi:hypothetical protein